MRARKHVDTFQPLLRMGGLFGLFGGVLFVWVWWPIQAERNLVQLRKVEALVFQKKSELNLLNDRFSAMTSLTILDQWAKRHGPWIPTNAENVIPIE